MSSQTQPTILRAGALTVRVDSDGWLRDINVDGHRILDAISVMTRDRLWETADVAILEKSVSITPHGFVVNITARHTRANTRMLWSTRFAASSTKLECTATGHAELAQFVNRAGFVILHPLEARQRTVVAHTTRGEISSVFGERVDAGVLFSDVRALEIRMPHCPLTITFGGDEFETEDHRNWTDAGWKTYSTPVSRATPRHLEKATEVHQSVVVEWRNPRVAKRTVDRGQDVRLGDATSEHVPAIGSVSAAAGRSGGPSSESIGALGLAFLATEVDADSGDERLLAAQEEARTIDLPLRVVGAVRPERLQIWLERVATNVPVLHSIAVVDARTGSATAELLQALDALPASLREFVGTGTRGYFAELNRLDLALTGRSLFFTVCPQVHHGDSALVLDTALALPDVMTDARRLSGDVPLHIGPLSLRQRLNVHEPSWRLPALGAEPGDDIDPRQRSPFSAVYALMAISGLHGAASVTVFQTFGPRGIVSESPSPSAPLERVITWLTARRDDRLLSVTNTAPRAIAVLATASAQRALVANRTAYPRDIRVDGLPLLELEAWGIAEADIVLGTWHAI